MTGFMSSDGSELVGGKLPGGVGEALNLDANGNLLVNAGVGIGSIGDGLAPASIAEEALAIYNSGGPPLANGVPSQLAFDRLRGWLGKATQTNAITATLVGDTQLVFSAAPKTILPGQAIKILGSGGGPEYVYVTNSYVPSPTATTIPIQSPVVNAGQNSATWNVFSPAGPSNGAITPEGIAILAEALFDVATGNLYAKQGFRGIQDVSVGGRASTAIAASVATNTVIKGSPGRLARILVTATGTAAMSIYDNATTNSGTIIGMVPTTAAVGTIIDCQAPALNGITVAGAATNPGVTIFYY